MTYPELAEALRQLKVETGSLACMGCGHEHNCGIYGCAILREAADALENQKRNVEALQKEIGGLRAKRDTTNGGRIRAMTDDELAEFIPNWSYTNACKCDEASFVDCSPVAEAGKRLRLMVRK